jgi:hypothetical protein
MLLGVILIQVAEGSTVANFPVTLFQRAKGNPTGSPNGKIEFLHWFSNINMPSEKRWLIVGDFNLTRRPENRNIAGGH